MRIKILPTLKHSLKNENELSLNVRGFSSQRSFDYRKVVYKTEAHCY